MRRIKDKEIREYIGFVIRYHRKRHNITQEALARDIKTSVTYVNLVECGHRIPSFDMLERFARRFGKRVEDLIKETNSSEVLAKVKLITLAHKVVETGDKKIIEKINNYIKSLLVETK